MALTLLVAGVPAAHPTCPDGEELAAARRMPMARIEPADGNSRTRDEHPIKVIDSCLTKIERKFADALT
jgi:hypothetical protein